MLDGCMTSSITDHWPLIQSELDPGRFCNITKYCIVQSIYETQHREESVDLHLDGTQKGNYN